MTKKAQNVGQIFVYILTIVIMGIILLFGYRSIISFRDSGEEMVVINFQKDLQSAVSTITSQYNTVRKKDFDLSIEYKQVCFVRNYDTNNYVGYDLDAQFAGYPFIQDEVETSPESINNVFLIKNNKEVAKIFEVGKISFSDAALLNCFNLTGSTLSIKIEGRGDHVIIS